MTPASDRRAILVSTLRVLSVGSLVAGLLLLLATLVTNSPLDLPLASCCLSVAFAAASFGHWYEQARGFPFAALYFAAIAGCGLTILVAGDRTPRSTAGVMWLNVVGAVVGWIIMRWSHRAA